MTDTIRCPSCRAENPLSTKFCRQCGAALTNAQWAAQPPADEEGFVSSGVWHRPPGEFVRRAPRSDLKSGLLREGVQVPHGSIGVVVVDGKVAELLRPGFRTTTSWVDRLTNLVTNKLDRTDVYLVDLRALPIPFAFDATSGGVATKYQVIVELRVRPDPASLMRLIEHAVGDRDSLGARAFYDQVRTEVSALVQPRLTATRAEPAQLAAMEREVVAELARSVGDRYGVDLTARVSPVLSTVSLNVRVGGGASPATKRCTDCGHDLEASKKFCTKCGATQPVMTQPSRACGGCGALGPEGKKFCTKCGVPLTARPAAEAAIFTSDGQDVELDLVLRAQGASAGDLQDRLTPLVAAAVSKHVRAQTHAALATTAGFAALEAAVKQTLTEAVRTLGLEVSDVTVLDVRAKGEQWQLGARAELDQAMREVEMGREWMKAEAATLDLKAVQFDMLVRSQRIERDHAFSIDKDELADRRRRQELAEEGASLDVADVRRDASTAVAIDAAERARDRAIGTEDHADRLTGVGRANELTAQERAFARHHETEQARHEMGIERDVASHDAALAREAAALQAEQVRLGADTTAYAKKTLGETEVALARSKQELEIDAEAKRQGLQVDKLRAMAELDAKIREDELREQRQSQDAELRMRQELKGLSTDQMLAMQAGGAQGQHIAAALAEKFKAEAAATGMSADKQKELYERMLQEQKAAQAAAMAATHQANAQIAQVLQTLGAVATAAVSGQRDAQAAAAATTQRSAAQATSMAERAVTAMGNALTPAQPAGNATRSAPTESASSKGVAACPSCRSPVAPDDRMCGECGTRVS